MSDVQCWWGAKIEGPTLSEPIAWRCPNRAVRAVKPRRDVLKAWGVTDFETTHAPLCTEHAKEAEPTTEDWMDVEEWRYQQRSSAATDRSSGRRTRA